MQTRFNPDSKSVRELNRRLVDSELPTRAYIRYARELESHTVVGMNPANDGIAV